MKTILSALLWFAKSMKDGKSLPRKYYYFFLPNNGSIQASRCSVFDNMLVKMTGSRDNWLTRK